MFKRLLFILISLLYVASSLYAQNGYVVMKAGIPFARQCTKENTIYEIRSDFNLGGETVRLPSGCVLKVNGGTINNGVLFLGSNTKIIGAGEIFELIRFVIEDKDIQNILIDRIELNGYKKAAQNREEIVVGVRVLPGGSVNNLTISNCVIRGYNAGVFLRGSNIYIKDNVFYDNGHNATNVEAHDDEVDVCAGFSPNDIETSNFIITGNRFLSKNVHRNIDCGELLSEDNILISNNICVSMDGLSKEAVAGDVRKAQCILVGYTGTSTQEKGVIITNNICKGCSWAGIYVRANNTAKTEGRNGYVALISNNYIENVLLKKGSKFGAAIACEVRDGSIISNNVIKNCTQGINIGQVFANGHVKVFANSIDKCEWGILNDAVAQKVDIANNSITNVNKQGIAITEHTSASGYKTEKFVNIADNTITLTDFNARNTTSEGFGNPVGLFLFNIGTISYRVSSNFIHGNNINDGIGIQFRCNSETSLLLIRDNYISGCHVGISRVASNDVFDSNYKLIENILGNCTIDYYGF